MSSPETPRSAPTINFSYIKGNEFRVVHVDGAIGSLTPRGLINMVVFSERAAIPRTMVHPIQDDGQLGPPVEVESRPGIVRELEACLMLDKDVALAIRTWLDGKLKELEQAVAASAAATKPQGS